MTNDALTKVYIGGLSEKATRKDVADVFAKYSSVGNVWVAQNPPGFGFVELTDVQDARDAVHSLDGTKIAGARVRVEISSKVGSGTNNGPSGKGKGGKGGRGSLRLGLPTTRGSFSKQETDLINRVTSEKTRADHKFQNTSGFDAKKRNRDDQSNKIGGKNVDGNKSSNFTVNKNQNRCIEGVKNDRRLKGGAGQKEVGNKEDSYRREEDTRGDRRWLVDKREGRRQQDNWEDRRVENGREDNWGSRRLEDNREDRRQEDYKIEKREYRVREEYYTEEREDRRREDNREDRRRENEREDRYRGEGVRRRESFSPSTVREMEKRESVRDRFRDREDGGQSRDSDRYTDPDRDRYSGRYEESGRDRTRRHRYTPSPDRYRSRSRERSRSPRRNYSPQRQSPPPHNPLHLSTAHHQPPQLIQPGPPLSYQPPPVLHNPPPHQTVPISHPHPTYLQPQIFNPLNPQAVYPTPSTAPYPLPSSTYAPPTISSYPNLATHPFPPGPYTLPQLSNHQPPPSFHHLPPLASYAPHYPPQQYLPSEMPRR